MNCWITKKDNTEEKAVIFIGVHCKIRQYSQNVQLLLDDILINHIIAMQNCYSRY